MSSKFFQKYFLTIGGLHEDKLRDTLYEAAPTNVKMVHQTFLLHIESNIDRLRLLSPTHGQRFQQQSGQTTVQSGLINKPKSLMATRQVKIKKIKISRFKVVGALRW